MISTAMKIFIFIMGMIVIRLTLAEKMFEPKITIAIAQRKHNSDRAGEDHETSESNVSYDVVSYTHSPDSQQQQQHHKQFQYHSNSYPPSTDSSFHVFTTHDSSSQSFLQKPNYATESDSLEKREGSKQDKKGQKTVILAIPVKLSMQDSKGESTDSKKDDSSSKDNPTYITFNSPQQSSPQSLPSSPPHISYSSSQSQSQQQNFNYPILSYQQNIPVSYQTVIPQFSQFSQVKPLTQSYQSSSPYHHQIVYSNHQIPHESVTYHHHHVSPITMPSPVSQIFPQSTHFGNIHSSSSNQNEAFESFPPRDPTHGHEETTKSKFNFDDDDYVSYENQRIPLRERDRKYSSRDNDDNSYRFMKHQNHEQDEKSEYHGNNKYVNIPKRDKDRDYDYRKDYDEMRDEREDELMEENERENVDSNKRSNSEMRISKASREKYHDSHQGHDTTTSTTTTTPTSNQPETETFSETSFGENELNDESLFNDKKLKEMMEENYGPSPGSSYSLDNEDFTSLFPDKNHASRIDKNDWTSMLNDDHHHHDKDHYSEDMDFSSAEFMPSFKKMRNKDMRNMMNMENIGSFSEQKDSFPSSFSSTFSNPSSSSFLDHKINMQDNMYESSDAQEKYSSYMPQLSSMSYISGKNHIPPLNLLAGYGRDYGSIQIGHKYYPALFSSPHSRISFTKPSNYKTHKLLGFQGGPYEQQMRASSSLPKILTMPNMPLRMPFPRNYPTGFTTNNKAFMPSTSASSISTSASTTFPTSSLTRLSSALMSPLIRNMYSAAGKSFSQQLFAPFYG